MAWDVFFWAFSFGMDGTGVLWIIVFFTRDTMMRILVMYLRFLTWCARILSFFVLMEFLDSLFLGCVRELREKRVGRKQNKTLYLRTYGK